MKFSAKEDIEAPLADVFAMITDFESFERSAMRRGAKVQRVDELAQPGVGMLWDVSFNFRGRKRELRLELVHCDPDTGIAFQAQSGSMNGSFVVDLLALSKTRTRMSVELEMQPQNLSARLLIQSFKLAKAGLTKRFKLRVAEYSKEMEYQYKRSV